jgi:hypothetical protein
MALAYEPPRFEVRVFDDREDVGQRTPALRVQFQRARPPRRGLARSRLSDTGASAALGCFFGALFVGVGVFSSLGLRGIR